VACNRSDSSTKSELERHLRESGTDTIGFRGLQLPELPKASIYESSDRDFRIVLVSDAVKDASKIVVLSEWTWETFPRHWIGWPGGVSLSDIGA
jgi:nicotinamidase-related amidase